MKKVYALIHIHIALAHDQHTYYFKAPAEYSEEGTLIVITIGAGEPDAGGRGGVYGHRSRRSVGRGRPVFIVVAKVGIPLFGRKVLREHAVKEADLLAST